MRIAAASVSKRAVWKLFVAGACGSLAHTALMAFKAWSGLLPSFQPYEALQLALARLTGGAVPPLVPWVLSFLNGATAMSLIFGRLYPWLPGASGAAKGAAFGVIGWLAMGLVFFPLIGLGVFAADAGHALWPAGFSLAMLLAYSIVLGMVYAALGR
jgi:hypothetical protein